jgi:phosphoglycerate dehydrogenase-like enzyme
VVAFGVSERERRELAAVAPEVEVVRASTQEEALAAAADADGILGLLNARLLEAAPRLRRAQVGSAGVERYVSLGRIASREVVLTNAQALMGPQIADHAVALLLALMRALPAAIDNQRGDHAWDLPDRSRERMAELRGKTVLVAGLGGIGREVAKRLHAFGARVVATNRSGGAPPPFVERLVRSDRLLELAALAHAVVVCVPLTPETDGMFDARFFATLPPGAWLVNIARGRCVDTGALVEALKSGRLAGAGLDVTDPEPLPPSHELWAFPNVIVTPHDAGATDAGEDRRFLLFRENLRRFAAGEALLSVVDPVAGY